MLPVDCPKRPIRILVIDDDASVLQLLDSALRNAAFEPVLAEDVNRARALIRNNRPEHFDCALIGKDLKGKSGLELAVWIAQKDSCLSRILLVDEYDNALLLKALRLGICDLVELPFKTNDLLFCLETAAAKSRRKREQTRVTMEARGATRIHRRMVPDGHQVIHASLAPDYETRLESRFFPALEAGGDFFNSHLIDDQHLLLIAGDVSGHDISAGFISTYFMGICRGMLAKNATPDQICQHFHEFLLHEWNGRRGPTDLLTSLSLCFLLLDFEKGLLHCSCNGFPSPLMFDARLEKYSLGGKATPLGWYDTPVAPTRTFPMPAEGSLIMFSDGMEYLLDDENTSCPFELADRLLEINYADSEGNISAGQSDDVLVTRMSWKAKRLDAGMPMRVIFCTHYAGDQHPNIDKIQGIWEHLLIQKLPGLARDKLLAILLCCREAMLNSMRHGCQGDPSHHCSLKMAFIGQDTLRVRIRDDGLPFPASSGNNADSNHIPFGLQIIKGFTCACKRSPQDNILIMDFLLSDAKPPARLLNKQEPTHA